MITDAPSSDFIVKVLKGNSVETVDTVATDESGELSYKLEIEEGQVEFVYLYRGDRRLASLILKRGDSVDIDTDTLGNYTVAGSEESVKLAKVDEDYRAFIRKMNALNKQVDNATTAKEELEARQAMGREYIAYYRDRVKYVMDNSHSIAAIPVLYQTFGENVPVFGQSTDAIHFKNLADSLELDYPQSRYVKALRKEAQNRLDYLKVESIVSSAEQVSYPDIELPDLNGQKCKLSDVEAKVVLIHFWTASSVEQKMFNTEVLKPLYEDYHDKGLEIYQVAFDMDKVLWAQVVKNQELEWVSVCDSRGTASPYIATYNLPALPAFFILNNGELVDGSVVNEASLRKLIRKLL